MKPILNFPTIEAAAAYAESHQPYKRALEAWDDLGGYAKIYGGKAEDEALHCWGCITTGKVTEWEIIKHMRALSWALPPSVFEYRSKS